jgi:hypothetical protein
MDVLQNSMFNIAEAMGAEMLPDLITNLEALNAWGQDGGWKDTADALAFIADKLQLIGTAAMVTADVINAFRDMTGIDVLDPGDTSYEDALSHLVSAKGRLQGGDQITPPPGLTGSLTRGLFQGPAPTGATTTAAFDGIPAYAGRSGEYASGGGGTITAGRSYAGVGGTPIIKDTTPTLNTINNSIKESNELLKTIAASRVGSPGGMGAGGSSQASPETIYARMKQNYQRANTASLRL